MSFRDFWIPESCASIWPKSAATPYDLKGARVRAVAQFFVDFGLGSTLQPAAAQPAVAQPPVAQPVVAQPSVAQEGVPPGTVVTSPQGLAIAINVVPS